MNHNYSNVSLTNGFVSSGPHQRNPEGNSSIFGQECSQVQNSSGYTARPFMVCDCGKKIELPVIYLPMSPADNCTPLSKPYREDGLDRQAIEQSDAEGQACAFSPGALQMNDEVQNSDHTMPVESPRNQIIESISYFSGNSRPLSRESELSLTSAKHIMDSNDTISPDPDPEPMQNSIESELDTNPPSEGNDIMVSEELGDIIDALTTLSGNNPSIQCFDAGINDASTTTGSSIFEESEYSDSSSDEILGEDEGMTTHIHFQSFIKDNEEAGYDLEATIPPLKPQPFVTLEELKEYCYSHGEMYGYQLRIADSKRIISQRRYSTPKSEEHTYSPPQDSLHEHLRKAQCPSDRRYLRFVCSKSESKRKSTVSSRLSRPKTTNCQVTILARRSSEGWELTNKHDVHNHSPEIDPYIQYKYNRLPEKYRSEVRKLIDLGIRPRLILQQLRQEHGLLSCFSIGSIYVESRKYDNELCNGLNKIEAALELLENNNFTYKYLLNNERKVTHLFFAYNEALELAKSFSNVIQMDCTYNTNRQKLPLLNITGFTNRWTTFNIAFAFLPGEKEADFVWALTQLKECLTLEKDKKIVIVTDRDLALGKAIQKVFGSLVLHLLCRWHINKDVKVQIARRVKGKDADMIRELWYEVIESKTRDQFREAKSKLFPILIEKYPKLLHYLRKTWLKYREKFLHSHISHILHFNSTSTSRTEGNHFELKRLLLSGNGDIYTFLKVLIPALIDQINNHKHEVATELALPIEPYKSELEFQGILCHVTQKCLSFLLDKIKISKLEKTSECTGIFTKTFGLPCSHKIRELRDMQLPITLDLIHQQYWLTPVRKILHKDNDFRTCISALDTFRRSLPDFARQDFIRNLYLVMNTPCNVEGPDVTENVRGRKRKIDTSLRSFQRSF